MAKLQLRRGNWATIPTLDKSEVVHVMDRKKLATSADGATNIVMSPLQKWLPVTLYVANEDFVFQGGNIFECIVGHTSHATTFSTDAANWKLVSRPGTRVVANIAARNAITGYERFDGLACYVINATADTSVATGAALYVYDEFDAADWVKISEFESLDVTIDDATETTKGIIELATQAEAEAGTSSSVVPTALGVAQAIAALTPVVPDASDTVKGRVELATATEFATGTDTARAVTPSVARNIKYRLVYSNDDTDGASPSPILFKSTDMLLELDMTAMDRIVELPTDVPEGFTAEIVLGTEGNTLTIRANAADYLTDDGLTLTKEGATFKAVYDGTSIWYPISNIHILNQLRTDVDLKAASSSVYTKDETLAVDKYKTWTNLVIPANTTDRNFLEHFDLTSTEPFEMMVLIQGQAGTSLSHYASIGQYSDTDEEIHRLMAAASTTVTGTTGSNDGVTQTARIVEAYRVKSQLLLGNHRIKFSIHATNRDRFQFAAPINLATSVSTFSAIEIRYANQAADDQNVLFTDLTTATSSPIQIDMRTGDMFKSDNLFGLANTGTARTNLGLGTMATQAANSVAITGGAISGITDMAVADGGTGASTVAGARTNLEVDSSIEVTSKAIKYAIALG